jgi:hypothetical protein
VLAATPKTLEVGIGNGPHGWLKIRAEMDGGVVTASLSTRSVAGQEMLHRELPSLTTYLQEERVAVHSVVIDKPVSDSSLTSGGGGGRDAGESGTQTRGNARQEQNGGLAAEGIWSGNEDGLSYRGLNSDEGLLPIAVGGSGSWLNLRV